MNSKNRFVDENGEIRKSGRAKDYVSEKAKAKIWLEKNLKEV